MIESIPTEDDMAKAPRKKKKILEGIPQLTKDQIDSTRDPLDLLIDKFGNQSLGGIEKQEPLNPEKRQNDEFKRIAGDIAD